MSLAANDEINKNTCAVNGSGLLMLHYKGIKMYRIYSTGEAIMSLCLLAVLCTLTSGVD